jgi:hypothetical protein
MSVRYPAVTIRTSNAAVLASTGGLLAALCVWAFAARIDDQSQQISLGSSLHLTARGPHWREWYRNLDRQLLVFNDVKNSPHRGLITYHSYDVWRPLPGISIERSGPGISAWVSGSGPAQTNLPWFTVRVSLFYPMVLFAIAPLAWLLRRFKRAETEKGSRRKRGHV